MRERANGGGQPTDAGRWVPAALPTLMCIQALLGLAFPAQYRDAPWITATWFGNDLVTLAVAVPMLILATVFARRGSVRGLLGWLGLAGYAAYNYGFYLFGASLNTFFPLYVALLVLAVTALISTLSRLDATAIAAHVRPTTPVKPLGAYFTCLGIGLGTTWVALWAAYAFAGRPTPVEPEAFKVIAALDTSVMVPVLILGGVLLWRRSPWGYVIATIAGIQASLYLLVLSVSSAVAIQRGFVQPPGEAPIWGTLLVATATATLALLAGLDPAAQAHDLDAMPTRIRSAGTSNRRVPS